MMGALPLWGPASLRGVGASASGVSSVETRVTPEPFRKNAGIVSYPRRKLPPVADYAARCAALIRETFPAQSQHQMCIAAASATGASPDTFDRILSGLTKSPDARLMLAVMSLRAAMGRPDFDLGGGFSIRLIVEGQE